MEELGPVFDPDGRGKVIGHSDEIGPVVDLAVAPTGWNGNDGRGDGNRPGEWLGNQLLQSDCLASWLGGVGSVALLSPLPNVKDGNFGHKRIK